NPSQPAVSWLKGRPCGRSYLRSAQRLASVHFADCAAKSLTKSTGGLFGMLRTTLRLAGLSAACRRLLYVVTLFLLTVAGSLPARASELELKLPDLRTATFLGVNGWTLLTFGLVISALGFVFGIAMYTHLRNLPVHESMKEISELIYETCKTYLVTQG